MDNSSFDLNCTRCKRLAQHLNQVRREFPLYHAKPVPPFGAAKPKLLIVGLAPGLHGANATGRPFTGDFAGILLYNSLYAYGFSNKAVAVSMGDGLVLKHCRITNAVKCLPPENKPTGEEITACNAYLVNELKIIKPGGAILALGGIAHQSVLKALDLKKSAYPFAHGKHYLLPNGVSLFTSYHCSRYNTQTKRLTEKMFQQVFAQIKTHLAL
jgi:uracil-DNA glycosylase family 4